MAVFRLANGYSVPRAVIAKENLSLKRLSLSIVIFHLESWCWEDDGSLSSVPKHLADLAFSCRVILFQMKLHSTSTICSNMMFFMIMTFLKSPNSTALRILSMTGLYYSIKKLFLPPELWRSFINCCTIETISWHSVCFEICVVIFWTKSPPFETVKSFSNWG